MNLQSKLEQFRIDNPYDVDTQAKRLLAADDKELLLYTLALGLATAKSRQRHVERDYIKNIGQAPPRERLVPGRVTGSVKVIPIKPSKRVQNAMQELIFDVWRINGEQKLGDANANNLADAIKREDASAIGHSKNSRFYLGLKERLNKSNTDTVRERWDEKGIRSKIEEVYGEFRRSEAGNAA